MSQEELASAAGVSEATVSRLETARFAARPRTVKALAAALGVEPAQLYGEEEG
jgi:transcriptional regulator with XRE-family HTH domain